MPPMSACMVTGAEVAEFSTEFCTTLPAGNGQNADDSPVLVDRMDSTRLDRANTTDT